MTAPISRQAPTCTYVACFLAGAVWDLLVTPMSLLRPRHRVARRALAEADLPAGRALWLDLALLRRRRRHRRFRHWMRRHSPELTARAIRLSGEQPLLQAAAARRGAIVVASHGGPPDGASLALRAMGLDVLELRVAAAQPWNPPPRIVRMERHATTGAGARWLVAGLREVRAGGVVRMPIDGFSPSRRRRVKVMGVPLPAAGGMATLARLARVPVFPMVCELRARGELAVRLGPALDLQPATAPSATRATGAEEWERTFLERAQSAIAALFEGRELEQLARVVALLRFRDFEETLHPGPEET
jgi:lauroyl/myristoyl acyltransferase